MGLEFRVLVSDLDQILGIDAVMAYLNRDENRNYHHHNFERAITSVFHDSLLPSLSQIADFETTWSDLGRLLRTAAKGKLGEADGERLDEYCSHTDYGELEKLANDKVLAIVENEFGGERGNQLIVAETWQHICARLFSHVHDVLTGKLDLRVCARGQTYCHDLYLIRKNPGTAQKYCSVKCRDAESQRQVRIRRKEQQEEIRV